MEHAWDALEPYRGKLFQGTWPSIPQMVQITVEKFPERIAFSTIVGKEKHAITYQDMYDRVLSVAQYVREQGVQRGDRVIINGRNSPEWAIAFLGVQFASAVVVPLDNQLTIDRVEALSAYSGAKAIFADYDILQKIENSEWFTTVEIAISLDTPKGSIGQPITALFNNEKHQSPETLPSEDDIAAILYTSGTTGNEKGVVLSHANFVSDVYQAGDPQFLAITEEDVFYALLPLHHSYTMTAVFLESLMHGCELLFGQSLVVSRVLNEMRTGKVSLFLAIPLLYNKLLAGLMKKVREKGILTYAFIRSLMWLNGIIRKVFHKNPGRIWFHQLLDGIGMIHNNLCICGGGPLSPKTFQTYQQLGLDFIQGYGLTETAPILTLNPVSRFKITSVGKVFPLVDMRIDNPDLFGVGEVQVKGPNICQGYYRDEENTKALFTDDGYLKTGDLGVLDKENYLYLKGRAKNMIVTEGGKNVYPEEIEDMFQLYAQIEQVMIRGYIANKSARAEGIEAVIYPNKDHYEKLGNSAQEIAEDVEKIIAEVNKKLVAYKKISKTTLLDKPMAMTSTKKIQRGKVSRTLERLRGNS